jgi:hypothetical protein
MALFRYGATSLMTWRWQDQLWALAIRREADAVRAERKQVARFWYRVRCLACAFGRFKR